MVGLHDESMRANENAERVILQYHERQKEMEDEILHYKQELESAHSEKSAVEEELGALMKAHMIKTQETEGHLAEVKDLRDVIAGLESKISSKDEVISANHDEILKLKRAIDAAEQKNAIVVSQLNEQFRASEQLRTRANRSENLQESLSDLQAANADLRKELEECIQLNDALRNEGLAMSQTIMESRAREEAVLDELSVMSKQRDK